MNRNFEKTVFKNSTIAYYWSSRLLPKGTRDDVFKLYSFFHTLNNYAKSEPANNERILYIKGRWESIKKDLQKRRVPTPLDDSVDERILANIAYIVYRWRCDPSWVDAFLVSVSQDAQKHTFKSARDQLQYLFGASEVPALCIVRVLDLPEEVLKYARLQARAFAYVHMLRSVGEHTRVGRFYFAKSELKKYGLKSLTLPEAQQKPAMFTEFVHAQLLHFATWQADANPGLLYVPKRYKAPLQVVVDDYTNLASAMKNDPFVIFTDTDQHVHHGIVTKVARVLKK